ncbi:MAG: magnesium transporter CorA family protein [Firmicutes bacterium]|nr:magnesium transporter CorA family protein [Bacillota bacterium]
MDESTFRVAFDNEGSKVVWHHVDGPDAPLKELLLSHRFSLSFYDSSESGALRAEFDDFQRFYAMRVYQMSWVKERGDSLRVSPFYIWSDREAVISWAPDGSPAASGVQQKLKENPDWVQSSTRLVYYLLDEVLGSLFPFLDQINDQIARLEQRALKRSQRGNIQAEVFRLKREILRTRRILASMRDAVSQVVRYWTANAANDSFYYMELYDHMIRLFDTIDTYRELVNSVLDLYMSSVSNHMNEIVKTLSLVTTVLLPASLVAALYGMNFDYLPLSHHRWGFLLIIAIIAVISGGLYWIFRRRRWI